MPALDSDLYRTGAKLTTRLFQRFLPEAKSTNYLAGQYWNDRQTDPAMADVLFHDGTAIRETSRGNVFMVKTGRVITPGQEVLFGVSRSIVLDIMDRDNI
jgi:branched-subunit amino acid aminotransferase/4-amino-4-deoxychorismate lyase